MLIAIGIILAIVVLGWAGNKHVHSETTINADDEVVWSVISNTDLYSEWNPVMELLEGQIKPDNKVKYRFTQSDDKSYEITSKVVEVISERLLNQKGGIPLVLTFDHKYTISPNGSTCILKIHEDYRGIGVYFWNPEPVGLAYDKLAKAIKDRAESLK